MGTSKLQSNGPSYSNTVAVDGWAVTLGTAMRGLGGLRPHWTTRRRQIHCGSVRANVSKPRCKIIYYCA